MTRQEIQALIDAKIKGQGTAVDAGSVLPAILTGILDLIEQGGGGGTADAVQYIPQELTGAQQMQARKNQGLYYSENVEETTLNWDGDTTGKVSFNQFYYKVSDDAPSKDIIKSITLIQGGNTQVFENPTTTVDTHNPKVYAIGQAFAMVVTEDFEDGGSTVTKGIYFAGVEGTYVSQLVYGGMFYHTILPEYMPNSVNPLIVSFINNNGRWMVENNLLASYIIEEIKKGRAVIGKLTNYDAVYYTQTVSLTDGGLLAFLFISSITEDDNFTAGATNPLSISDVPGIFYITVTYNRNNVLDVSGINNENNAIPMWKQQAY